MQGEAGRNRLFSLKKRRLWLRQLNAVFTYLMGEYRGGARLLLDEEQWVEVATCEIPIRY